MAVKFNNLPVTLFTRGKSALEITKVFLHKRGFGSNRGPVAVELNLIQGLKNIGATYNVNPKTSDIKPNVCVLRSMSAYLWAASLNRGVGEIIIGPNFSAHEVKSIYENKMTISCFLAASYGVKFTYEQYGIPEQKIRLWPVGIDTAKYGDTRGQDKAVDCLLYFKRRTVGELEQVKKLLADCGQTHIVVSYGNYDEDDFRSAIEQCRYAIILDGTESQGIAIESIMSANLPLFVFDQIYLGDSPKDYIREHLIVTSVPYWDERCGIKVPTDMFCRSSNLYMAISQAKEHFQGFLNNMEIFKPRDFVLENLTLEKQASEFLNFFK